MSISGRELTVEPVGAGDLEAVSVLFEEVYRETFQKEPPRFAEATLDEEVFVAKHDGTLSGLATVYEPEAFLHFLFVEKTARGQGVGQALVKYLQEQYEAPLTLKCLKENQPALEFYRKTGWTEVAEGSGNEGAYVTFCHNGPLETDKTMV